MTGESGWSLVRADVLPLRHHGARRGLISQHRGLKRMRATPSDAVSAAALAAALTALWLLVFPHVARAWAWLFAAARGPMGLPGTPVVLRHGWPAWADVALPQLAVGAVPPGRPEWWLTALGTLLVAAGTFWLPPRAVPLRYLLRAVAGVQVTSLVYFAAAPDWLVRRLPDVPAAALAAGAIIIALVPLVHGFTFYLFDVSFVRKAALTAATLGHLAVLLPLLYLLQLEILRRGSLLFLPTCFVVLGPFPVVMSFVALYGWGASWPGVNDTARAAPPAHTGTHPVPAGSTRASGVFRALSETRRG